MHKWILTTAVLVAVAATSMLAIAKDKNGDMMAQAQLNEKAPNFTLANVETGESWSLSDNQGKFTVIVFESIHCPWNYLRPDGGYERVLKPMAAKWKDKGVEFVAINSNKNESDADVKAYAEKVQLGYPILRDPGAKVADQFGAQTTPHVFVINKEGVLVYRGGIEQAPGRPSDCGQMQEQYLEPVLVALTEGKPLPYTETKSKGCGIKR